jgi:hypothetical protein
VADVEVGGGGLPGSPYAPNIASSSNWTKSADIPASGVEAYRTCQRIWRCLFPGDFFGLAKPKDTTVVISNQRLEAYFQGYFYSAHQWRKNE